MLPPLSVTNPSMILRATLPRTLWCPRGREFQDPARVTESGRSVEVNCGKKVAAAVKGQSPWAGQTDAKVLCIPSGVYSEIEPLKSLQ